MTPRPRGLVLTEVGRGDWDVECGDATRKSCNRQTKLFVHFKLPAYSIKISRTCQPH